MNEKNQQIEERYDDVTVILPTLNEGKNIQALLLFIISNYKYCNIIVSDDGSDDGTKETVSNFKYDKLFFLDRSNQKIHGLTASVLEAIDLVKTEYFVVMDADWQHPPEKIKDIVIILRSGKKLIIASRAEVEEGWGLVRRLISYAGTIIGKISLLLRGKNYLRYDILGGFFGCDTFFWNECVSASKRDSFMLRGYKILFDFLKCAPSRVDVGDVRYKFQTRKSESSKISLKIYFEYLKSCLLK